MFKWNMYDLYHKNGELAKMIVDTWINTEFEGGRHQRRVDLLMEIEEKN